MYLKKNTKKVIKRFIPQSLMKYRRYRHQIRFVKNYQSRRKVEIPKYVKSGKNICPPHGIKENYVEKFAKEFDINILVETGTYLGEMVYAMRNNFEHIISIELDKELYENASNFFRKDKHIEIIQGDSSKVLPEILKNINQSCLFWLDGHYSGGITAKGELSTPIVSEISFIKENAVSNNIDHVILIDDARDFNGTDGYPTIKEFEKFVNELFPDYLFKVQDDIIVIHK